MINYSLTITETIEQLRQLIQIDRLSDWLIVDGPNSLNHDRSFSPAPINDKRQITWPAGRQIYWLAQKIVIPPDLHTYPLTGLTVRLCLTWWADITEIFINGQLVHQGDLFDSSVRLLLTNHARVGETWSIALKLISPVHDQGALIKSLLVYENITNSSPPPLSLEEKLASTLDPGFLADELTVLLNYFSQTTLYNSIEAKNTLETITLYLKIIDWENLADRDRFNRSLLNFRQTLAAHLPPIPAQIHLLGHAHLDMAWLWPVAETWQVAQNTFESVLKLQKDYPELTYCHTTSALYEWIEKHRPDLFTEIQAKVTTNQWEIVGGMWIEPDLNLISGESIVRQLLYGQLYIKEKFGVLCQTAWLADTFGFNWQLPQLLRQAGIAYFVTQKLRWNDTNKFPHGLFWWEGLDGTKILSFMSPPIGESIEPIKMINYLCEWQNQTNFTDAFWLPGVGDHGGGPTQDMLEIYRRWQTSPFFPNMKFTTFHDYLQSGLKPNYLLAEKELKSPSELQDNLPLWQDELYLEFHRGCYTTHADQKFFNRRCEGLLYQAELWASLATILIKAIYPQAELETLWKKVLFNQFHDILPGSSIPEVYFDANQLWQEVITNSSKICTQAIELLTTKISLASPPPIEGEFIPIIIFNSLNWSRSTVIELPLSSLKNGDQLPRIYDENGNLLPTQLSAHSSLLCLTPSIPSIGWQVLWLTQNNANNFVTRDRIFHPPAPEVATSPQLSLQRVNGRKVALIGKKWPNATRYLTMRVRQNLTVVKRKYKLVEKYTLENNFLRVKVDRSTGEISSIFDKVQRQEILAKPGNQLQAFRDEGQYWDAWNIDPEYAEKPLASTTLKKLQWRERGKVRQILRVVRQLGKSEFTQDYILEANSPLVKIATKVDWRDRHILVKTSFTFTFTADHATYEIPCGAIERSTQMTTPIAQAKWEVPALRWADLSCAESGVSLLNDSKYGYDAQPNQLRLTLLRGITWPDANADVGKHEFTYAIYPHSGNWQTAKTVQHGYELNIPMIVNSNTASSKITTEETPDQLPAKCQVLDLGGESLVLMTMKRSELEPETWIIRCYESEGNNTTINIRSNLFSVNWQPIDLLETTLSDQSDRILPWQIQTIALHP